MRTKSVLVFLDNYLNLMTLATKTFRCSIRRYWCSGCSIQLYFSVCPDYPQPVKVAFRLRGWEGHKNMTSSGRGGWVVRYVSLTIGGSFVCAVPLASRCQTGIQYEFGFLFVNAEGTLQHSEPVPTFMCIQATHTEHTGILVEKLLFCMKNYPVRAWCRIGNHINMNGKQRTNNKEECING